MTTRSFAASAPFGTLGTLAILGIVAFVMVSAVLHEPTSGADSLFDASPPTVVTITPGAAQPTGGGRLPSLTSADVDAVAHDVPDVVAFSRVVLGTAPVAVGTRVVQIRIEGVDPSYGQVTNAIMTQGTLFGPADASAANPVAVLGQTAAGRLFPGGSPIGQTVRIRGVPFTVIGVLAAQGSSSAIAGPADAIGSPAEAILIPFQTGQVRLFGPSSLSAVLLRIRDSAETTAVTLQVQDVLRQRHDIHAGQSDGFTITANDDSASPPPAQTPAQLLGRLAAQYRQYTCQAKGLCPAP